MKWAYDRDDQGNVLAQHAVADDGTRYDINGHDKEWTATVTAPGGKPVVLNEKPLSIGAAYGKCIKHSKGEEVAA